MDMTIISHTLRIISRYVHARRRWWLAVRQCRRSSYAFEMRRPWVWGRADGRGGRRASVGMEVTRHV
jgi:hypothetical protein